MMMARFRKHPRLLWTAVISSLILLFTAAAAILLWQLAPRWLPDPTGILQKQTPVRIYYDRYGKEAYLERTYDVQWRFHTPLSAIPKHVIQVILAAEDRNFYDHSGVDYGSICRAMFQNITHFRIVSGASTITMQLAGMTFPARERSLKRKIHQALIARKLEQMWSTEKILKSRSAENFTVSKPPPGIISESRQNNSPLRKQLSFAVCRNARTHTGPTDITSWHGIGRNGSC